MRDDGAGPVGRGVREDVSVGQTSVLVLIEQAIESGRSAEEVCASCPELIGAVRRGIQAYRLLESRLDDYFPDSRVAGEPAAHRSELPRPELPGYAVTETLGRGGMGVVYLARHEKLGRQVAIKMLLAGPYASKVERERFQREARVLASVRHPNIVSVYDVGEADGYPYFTMEFMGGGTLVAGKRSEPHEPGKAATIARTLADAVEHAHQAGIIHRDLKPGNILLDEDGTPKISDFGIARSDSGDLGLTIAGARLGTPSYMAPEQVEGRAKDVGPATDVYALGAILYEMLTGRPPFLGDSPTETDRQVVAADPVAPSRLNPKVPRDLETICLTCLRKEPAKRYASAAALRDDLDRQHAGEPIVARPVGVLERAAKWARRRPDQATMGGAVLVALATVVVFAMWFQQLQSQRQLETALREQRARQAIESAIGLADDLRVQRRWVQASHVLEDASVRLDEAQSPDLHSRLEQLASDLAIAIDLDRIRRRLPEIGRNGYNYRPALREYEALFERIGIGLEVPAEIAAEFVRYSVIRDELLVGIGCASFAAFISREHDPMHHWLVVSGLAAPDAWGNYFGDAKVWNDEAALLTLAEQILSLENSPPSYQIVILATRLADLGYNPVSIELLRQAQRNDDHDFWVNLELGNALYRGAQYAEASQYFRAAVVIQPDNPIAWTGLAAMLGLADMGMEGLIACERAIELEPTYALAWEHMIYQLFSMDRPEEALAAYDRAVAIAPSNAEPLRSIRSRAEVQLGRSIAMRCDWERGVEVYGRGQSIDPWETADPWFEYAALLLLHGDHAGYEAVRDRMIEDGERGSMRRYLVARTVTLAPNSSAIVERAERIAASEIDRLPGHHWSLFQRAALNCRQGRYERAIELIHEGLAVESNPGKNVVGWAWLAVAYHGLGEEEAASRWRSKVEALLEASEGMYPDNAEAIELHFHNWLEAQVLLREVATSAP